MAYSHWPGPGVPRRKPNYSRVPAWFPAFGLPDEKQGLSNPPARLQAPGPCPFQKFVGHRPHPRCVGPGRSRRRRPSRPLGPCD